MAFDWYPILVFAMTFFGGCLAGWAIRDLQRDVDRQGDPDTTT